MLFKLNCSECPCGTEDDNFCDYISKEYVVHLKGLLHCFSTCIEITGKNWYCFNLKNVENCKEKFQRVKKL